MIEPTAPSANWWLTASGLTSLTARQRSLHRVRFGSSRNTISIFRTTPRQPPRSEPFRDDVIVMIAGTDFCAVRFLSAMAVATDRKLLILLNE
jgi:hypothetical protein